MTKIQGLSDGDQNTLDKLTNKLEAKAPRNRIRAEYYDARYVLKDLGIAIPPNLKNADMVLGWPAKAVDVLSRRCNLDGFVIPGGSSADLGIDDMCAENNMEVEAPQAHASAFIHACAFIATTLGDEQSGEPKVLITARDATSGTGLWDPRRRRLSAALAIVETSESGEPIDMVMYLPDRVVSMVRSPLGKWSVSGRKHKLGRVPVEPLVYQPRLGRPFGSSRISRAVMSLTDSALRTVFRSEIGGEFYTSPQRWALNVAESAFQDESGKTKGQWESIIGRVWAIGPGEEGDPDPTVGQFQQMTMQPHTDQLRMWATLFAGETSIPVSSLGIVQDNPASAEAIFASKEELVIEAEAANVGFGVGWRNAVRTGYMLREGLTEVPKELLGLRAKFRDPSTPSRSAAADSMQKTIQTYPWMAESDTALELAGFDQTTVARLLADKRKAQSSQLVQALTSAAATAAQNPTVAALAGKTDGDIAAGT